MSEVKIQFQSPFDVSAVQRRQMIELMQRYYIGVDWTTFTFDLEEKDFVMLVLDDANIVGFTTARVFRIGSCDVEGISKPLRVLFSGDTILDKSQQGNPALLGQWLEYVMTTVYPASDDSLWWMLVSKGHRTYRFLSAWFRRFYPAWNVETPPAVRSLMYYLGRQYGGDRFDPRSGIVHHRTQRLRAGQFDPTPVNLANPHVRFFLESNPDSRLGSELLCLARLSFDNLKSAIRRRLESTCR